MICEGPFVYADPMAQRLLGESNVPRRALFLDRDGVINLDRGYVHTPEQTVFVPGVFEICRKAHGEGHIVVVVTNQAGIARGMYSETQFVQYTRWVHEQFASQNAPLLATYYCPHHPTAGVGRYLCACDCRKPAPGMLLAAARDYDIDLKASALIGDQPWDMAAGYSAGVGTRLLLGENHPPSGGDGSEISAATIVDASLRLFGSAAPDALQAPR